jgi:hypothetical protein
MQPGWSLLIRLGATAIVLNLGRLKPIVQRRGNRAMDFNNAYGQRAKLTSGPTLLAHRTIRGEPLWCGTQVRLNDWLAVPTARQTRPTRCPDLRVVPT